MWTSKRKTIFLVTLALSLLFFVCSSERGSCSQAAAETAEEMILVSKKDWTKLKQNYEEQRKATEMLWKELLEARTALGESNQALDEARSLLETSQMTSDEMMQKLIQLLEESKMQKSEIERLKTELLTVKTESLNSYESLVKANQFLSDTRKEIKAREAEWRKRENQLERQRLTWQILFALAVGGGVAIAA